MKKTTYEEKVALRKQGLTYAEIAEQLGISRQAVAMALSEYNACCFRHIKASSCVYPEIRKWMNENGVSFSELARRMDLIPQLATHQRIVSYLSGKFAPRKPFIDKMLSITGMTYEKAFGMEEKNG